jgi:hypothetical protein
VISSPSCNAETWKKVRAAVIGSDETKSPLLVEHPNFARRHASLFVFKIAG